MTDIVISGGLYPANWKVTQKRNNENFIRFDTAELLILNWETKSIIKKINHNSEPVALNPSLMFKGCEVDEKYIRVVTNTEIVEYDKKNFSKIRVITNPLFNDLHGVKKHNDDYYVVNTGLEIIQLVNECGEVLKDYNLVSQNTWERFDKNSDYRKIGSTKPHESHINHIFDINNELFVTRMLQKDAVDLSGNKVFDIGVGNPHDGVLFSDKIYFTTTNGHIVVFSAETKERINVYDINAILEGSGYKPGGWCRGVLPLSDNRVLVGYTQLRDSKFKEFVSWTMKFGDTPAKTRVIEIDLDNNKIIEEFIYPDLGDKGSAIFSLLQI